MGYLSIYAYAYAYAHAAGTSMLIECNPLPLLGELIFIKEDGGDLLLGGINY